MWKIYESPKARRSLRKLPEEIIKKYEKWKDIVYLSGPSELRKLTGLKDEALRGRWFGFRSSRLNIQYRVLYKVRNLEVVVEVFDVNAHDYRR